MIPKNPEPVQFSGGYTLECARQARNRGWIIRQETHTATCPRCSGRGKMKDVTITLGKYKAKASANTQRAAEWLRENPHFDNFDRDRVPGVETALARRGMTVEVKEGST